MSVGAPYVVLDGIDGCGKTEMKKLLGRRLRDEGLAVEEVSDPGHTAAGLEIRRILKDKRLAMDPLTQALLFTAARRETSHEIREWQARGCWFLGDRWHLSTMVYQGLVLGVDLPQLWDLHRTYVGLSPDLYLILDLPAEEAMRRRSGRDLKEGASQAAIDRYESEGLPFAKKLREGYLQFRNLPEVAVIDASQSRELVFEQIWTVCCSRLLALQQVLLAGKAKAAL